MYTNKIFAGTMMSSDVQGGRKLRKIDESIVG